MPAAQLAPTRRETLLGQALMNLGQMMQSPDPRQRRRAEEGLLQLLDMVTTALEKRFARDEPDDEDTAVELDDESANDNSFDDAADECDSASVGRLLRECPFLKQSPPPADPPEADESPVEPGDDSQPPDVVVVRAADLVSPGPAAPPICRPDSPPRSRFVSANQLAHAEGVAAGCGYAAGDSSDSALIHWSDTRRTSVIDRNRWPPNNADMNSSGDTTTSAEPSGDGQPTPRDVLRWCADAAPELWFPSVQAQLAGIPRDSLDEPLLVLRQAGLVRVGDWVRGRGQGFAITPAGQDALAEPDRPIAPPDEMPPDEEARPEPPADTGLTAYDRGELTREAFLAQRPAVVTPVLIFANAAWFVAGLVVAWQMGVPRGDYLEGKHGAGAVLMRVGAASGPALLAGEWWRLLTSGFVHIGALHLFVNLFSLAMVGQVVERLWGRWRFVVLYALSGLAGACLAMAVQPMSLLAGASGSIWGLLLAVVAWLVRYRQHLPPEIVSLWLRRLIMVIGVNALISLAPQVSWEAHLGGALSGFAAAVFLDMTRAGAGRRSNLLGAAGLFVILAVAVGGLALAVRYSPRWQQLRQQMALFPIRVPTGQLSESAREAQTLINASLKPERVKAVRYDAVIALIVHSPKSVEAAQAEIRQLREDADRAAELLPAVNAPKILQIRAYLRDVERFAGMMARQLASGQVPTSDEWQAINAQMEKVEQGWIASTQ